MKKFVATISLFSLATFGFSVMPTAAAPVELIANGGFEEPIVGAPQLWDVYVTGDVPGWVIQWMDPTPADNKPADANLELHRGVLGPAGEGEQYAELDTDWDGPNGGINNEPASVRIFQDIPTTAGEKYTVSFQFSPRPNTGAADNHLKVWWGADLVADISQAGVGSTSWSAYSYELTAAGPTTRVAFEDHGTANSLGTFVDAVSVIQVPDEPSIVIVKDKNSAVVVNHVEADANTGDNYAGGSEGGDGGNGGDINNDGDGNVEGSTTGSGGRGGNGGVGGEVRTGNAGAGASAVNTVNSNVTRVNGCGCNNGGSFTVVSNRNRAVVVNHVEADADTGDNAAKGSEGGRGGNGGDIDNGNLFSDGDVEGSTTGSGGAGGAGSDGGLIVTGNAGSTASAINIVNRNRTRVR